MIRRNSSDEPLRDVDFRFLVKEDGTKVLQYRVQKTAGFRGWTKWEDVPEVEENPSELRGAYIAS